MSASPRQFVGFTRVVTSFGYFLTVPLLGVIALRAGAMTPAEVGVLIAVHTLARRSLAVPMGVLCDRWGAERVLVLGLLLEAAGYLLLASSFTFEVWLVALAVDGIGGVAYNAAGRVVIADASGDGTSAASFAAFHVATNVGALLGPLAAALLATAGAPQAVLVLSAALYAGSAAVAVGRYRRIRGPRPSTSAAAPWRQALAPARDPVFMAYCALTVPLWFGISLLVAALPLEAATRGLGYLDVGLINALNALAVVALGTWVGRRAEGRTVGERAGVLSGGALVMALGCLVALLPQPWALYTAMMVITVGELALIAAVDVVAVQLAPPGSTGVYLGCVTTAWALGGTAASLLAGGLLDGSAVGRHVFWASGAVVLAAGATGLSSFRRRMSGSAVPR